MMSGELRVNQSPSGMNRIGTIAELPQWTDELNDTFSNIEYFPSSLDSSSLHFMATWSLSLDQLPNNNLPQDVIAAGKEIDSIVRELWRSAVREEKEGASNCQGSPLETHPSQQNLTDLTAAPSEALFSVSKENDHDGAVPDKLLRVYLPCNGSECILASISDGMDSTHCNDDASLKTKPRHKCDQCNKCYAWSNDLVKHQKAHSGHCYSCSVCKKSYSLKSDLMKHQRVHNMVKDFLCMYCGKAFIAMGDFHKHVRIHTGERPYLCMVCKKSFTASDNYQKHIRIHSGDKPLSCKECGQKFLKKSNLLEHSKIHLGVKPYQCSICGLNFTQKTHLKNHVKTHSGLKPFHCLMCDQRFTRNADLNRHCKRAHGCRTGNCGL